MLMPRKPNHIRPQGNSPPRPLHPAPGAGKAIAHPAPAITRGQLGRVRRTPSRGHERGPPPRRSCSSIALIVAVTTAPNPACTPQ